MSKFLDALLEGVEGAGVRLTIPLDQNLHPAAAPTIAPALDVAADDTPVPGEAKDLPPGTPGGDDGN